MKKMIAVLGIGLLPVIGASAAQFADEYSGTTTNSTVTVTMTNITSLSAIANIQFEYKASGTYTVSVYSIRNSDANTNLILKQEISGTSGTWLPENNIWLVRGEKIRADMLYATNANVGRVNVQMQNDQR